MGSSSLVSSINVVILQYGPWAASKGGGKLLFKRYVYMKRHELLSMERNRPDLHSNDSVWSVQQALNT